MSKLILVIFLTIFAIAVATAETPLDAVLANQGKMQFNSVALSGVNPAVFDSSALADDHFKIHIGKEFMIPSKFGVMMEVQGLEFVDPARNAVAFLNEPVKTITQAALA